MGCPTKLFYTGKREYANQSLDDSFLAALADGGFQVGSLAKCYFPGGKKVEALDYDKAILETNKLLKQDQATIFEAAIATDKLLIRADILVKTKKHIQLFEVKSKSFNPEEEDPFNNKKGTIKSDWLEYLYDVAFQKHVIKQAFPQFTVSAYLMLVDKTVQCPTDGLNQKFRLARDNNGRTNVIVSDSLSDDDLTPQILCKVNVDDECKQIYKGKDGWSDPSKSFAERVEYFANSYISDRKIPPSITKNCKNCEFHTTENDEKSGLKSGKKECWKTNLGWNTKELKQPTVLDVWNFRKKNELIGYGCIKMSDISIDEINPTPDGKPGVSTSERQWLQIEKETTGDKSIWLDRENLQREMNGWVFPLHFIDFETSTVAIPFNAGRTPYEGIAFQFSHHIIHKDHTIEHAGQYLNAERGVFPNYGFIRALKLQLEGDNGTIFKYSNHENSFLNTIYCQLKEDNREIEDRDELCEFIRTITKSTNKSEDQWEGERNMVDMCEIVKRFYYDPDTGGSNSIKQILPSILNRSSFLQNKYSKPIYGAKNGIPSLNFKDWQWIRFKNGSVVDPYKILPKMFQDIPDNEMQMLLSDDDKLNNGGAALTAYARMQFEEMSDYECKEIQSALLKYCELDTMAMVMIYEGWKDLMNQITN